jgi:hypothetical protein
MPNTDPDTHSDEAPSLLSEIVKKIRSEPLLFAIAIVLLLGGLTAKANDLGANLSLFIFAITGLAALALLGYYVVAALHELQPRRATRGSSQSKYAVTISNASGPVATGDKARAEQHIGVASSQLSLQADLAQREENLKRLEAIEQLYQDGPQRRETVDKIESEKRAIVDIRRRLDPRP